MLYGRENETSVIDRVLETVRSGGSAALVVSGEPGIGKTALLDHAAGRAEGLQVIRRLGVESESDLPYAGLHLLLRPVLDRSADLPAPQARALEAALGLVGTGTADRLLVGLAVLSLLARAAEDRPVLCLIDDAHWLDRPSVEALAFAARRLGAEGIGLIMATREPAPLGLPELALEGLAPAAAAAMLQAAPLTSAQRYRVLAEAHGNPLALLELPTALRDGSRPPEPLPLTARLRSAFLDQVDRLPEATGTLLLIAAASDGLDEVLAAGAGLGSDVSDLGPAEAAGLVRVEDRTVVFRHPLIREAVYQRAAIGRRLAVHRALAETLDGDRRVWHLAAATVGPSEPVAEQLERTARRARAHTVAATAYERAARLSTEPAARVGRLTLAAESAIEAAELERAAALAHEAEPMAPDPLLRARLAYVRATAAFWRGEHREAHRLLLLATDLADGADAALAARMLSQGIQTGWYAGETELTGIVARMRALRIPLDEPIGVFARLAVTTLGGLLTAEGAEPPACEQDISEATAAVPGDSREVVMACGLPLTVGADEVTLETGGRLAAEYRAQGRIGAMPTVLYFLAEAEFLCEGRHYDALTTADAALRIAEDTGQHHWTGVLRGFLAMLAAVEGDQERCHRLDAAAQGVPVAHIPGVAWLERARAMLDLGHGRADAAMSTLDALTSGPGWYHVSAMRSVPDLVEAAVRCGEPARAAAAFARFDTWARRSKRPHQLALAERCRALLAEDAQAEQHYLAALRLSRQPFDQARTALLYGEWLRRNRRRTVAAGQLRNAADAFARLGARPWAGRARAELQACGVSLPAAPARGVLDDLTPQELRIIRLAAQGLSNKDIAAQLFLSPRTVGHHLYKAYPKLGVASRAELASLDLAGTGHIGAGQD
ncbi:ATP-binding protein [Spirillospora sp. NPDC050679]